MVGDGPDRENLEGQIAKLGLNDKVTLIPSRPDLSNVYKNADLFVIPSLWEGSPNALAEAMAHGLPAIGFKVDGVQQLIQHNQTGWLSPEISTEALASTLSIAMKDIHLFESFGRRAKTSANVYKDSEIFKEWRKLIMSLGFDHGHQ